MQKISAQTAVMNTALSNYKTAEAYYENLMHPVTLGNSELTPIALGELTKEQEAEIKQIIADMDEQKVDTNLKKAFRSGSINFDNSTYEGGLYTFKLNGTTYFTTYEDLMDAYYSNPTGINPIDAQYKMPYYNASNVQKTVEQTERALIETDGEGRFKTIKFENNSVVYTLNMETVTDDAAYQDAMNKYYYDNARYDKMVQDINAKTSIIQQEDRTLELRLKQLDTEEKALKTETEAVQKIVKDNVDDTFKTFNH